MANATERLAGQVALVTGASRGIGRTIATRVAAAGARVALSAREEPLLEDAADEIRRAGGEALALPADVTDPHQVQRLVEQTEAQCGPIDLLVNNAGRLGAIGPLWEADPEEWVADVRVDLIGVFYCCRAVLPHLVRRGHGRVVNIVGGGTTRPFPYASAYGAAKTAVLRLTETLAHELGDRGVRVFAVNPGLVRTAMTEQFVNTEAGRRWMAAHGRRLEAGRDHPPDLAAEIVVALAAGDLDGLHGRHLYAPEDHDRLDALRDEIPAIVSGDRRVLRLT